MKTNSVITQTEKNIDNDKAKTLSIAELFFAIDSARHINVNDVIGLCSIASRARNAISAGLPLDCMHPVYGLTPLSMAIKNQSVDLVSLLLENGANPNDGGDGLHPVILAANCFHIVINSLIANGANLQTEKNGVLVGNAAANALTKRNLHEESDYIRNLTQTPAAIDMPKNDLYLDKVHKLFNPEKLQSELANERNDSRIHFLKRLSESGTSRKYRKPNPESNLDSLYERFPNFSDTLDVLSEQTALSSLSANAVFTIRPILLVGPPGVGKTRFMREVSKNLGFEFTNISCGGITAGWILSGSSVSWSEGRPGMVHGAMRDGKTANPIILLDEIDKLSGDSRFSGFGPLFQLLDRESSCDFSDEAVQLAIDCSHVSWVATANDVSTIPEAILSRFTVIEVDAPSQEQMVSVIQSIYSDILNENCDSWGSHFSPEINGEMLEALEGQAPREIVKMILAAMGRAAKARKDDVYVLEATDFKDFKKKARKFGF